MTQRAQTFEKNRQLALSQQREDKKQSQDLNPIKSSVSNQLSQTKDSGVGRLFAKKMKTIKVTEKRYVSIFTK